MAAGAATTDVNNNPKLNKKCISLMKSNGHAEGRTIFSFPNVFFQFSTLIDIKNRKMVCFFYSFKFSLRSRLLGEKFHSEMGLFDL